MAGIGRTALEENWWGMVSYNEFTTTNNGYSPTWQHTTSTGYSGGPPMDFGYTEPKPVPAIERCEYCNIKAFPSERLCVGCGAPL